MPQNPWINDARADIGKYHDGPDVPMLAMRIATRFPDLAPYCGLAKPNTEWCGIMVAEWLSRYNIRPPYTPPGNNEGSFMFADSWADTSWGTHIPIGQEQPGDIAVFRSPHHVTMVSGNGKYVGGNQSDGVTETSFNRSGLRAIIRPPTADEVGQPNKPKPQEPSSAPVPLNPKLSNFGKCLPLLLKHEGGNDDDPRDPGGRTSRGILQREWNVWRASHPGLPSDVWEAPQDEIDAIYKQKYWDVLRCDEPPSGVDYAVFDYGVNSGNSRAAKVLQRLVGVDADGEIGPLTIGATLRVDPKTLVGQICDERLAFLKGLHTWPTFGGGWSRRVSEVRAAAEAMTTLPKPSTTPDQPGHEDHTQSNKNLTQVANISTGVGPMSDTHTSIPQLNLLNLPQLQAIKQQIDSLIKQGGAVPLHLPANVNLAQLADINKQLEAFVQLASTILPILSMFVPQLKVLIPILPVLTGLLNMGDDIAQAGNDPGKIADALAAHLKDVAQQVQASKLPGQG